MKRFILLLMLTVLTNFVSAAQMIIEIDTRLGGGDTFHLPLGWKSDVTIDWGDGTVEKRTFAGYHTYKEKKVYTISITGQVEYFGYQNKGYQGAEMITRVKSFGDLGLLGLSGAFYDAYNLIEVPAQLPPTVFDVGYLFYNASSFNQDISTWDMSNVTWMAQMFSGATSFDQDISNWNISKVSIMINMFHNAGLSVENYDRLLIGWPKQSLKNNVTFSGGNSKYSAGAASEAREYLKSNYNWSISDAGLYVPTTHPGQMVLEVNTHYGLDYTIGLVGNTDVVIDWGDGSQSRYTSPGFKYHCFPAPDFYTITISGNLDGFTHDTRLYPGAQLLTEVKLMDQMPNKSLSYAFYDATHLVKVPDMLPSTITDISYAFHNAKSFNQDLGTWDVSNVTNLAGLFSGAASFNAVIGTWDTQKVTLMNDMFAGAVSFNQDISSWNTGAVNTMAAMFMDAVAFNQDLSLWNTSGVTTMKDMFSNARSFNQDIGSWDIGMVEDMTAMFKHAVTFDQDLGGWNVSKVNYMTEMFKGLCLSEYNYNRLCWDGLKTEFRKMCN
jgi:surface protein